MQNRYLCLTYLFICDGELFWGQGVCWAWKFSPLTHGSGVPGNGCLDCQDSGFVFLSAISATMCTFIQSHQAVALVFGLVGFCFTLPVRSLHCLCGRREETERLGCGGDVLCQLDVTTPLLSIREAIGGWSMTLQCARSKNHAKLFTPLYVVNIWSRSTHNHNIFTESFTW